MNTPVSFSEEGAHFRISTGELDALDTIGMEQHGGRVEELPIGRAASLLRIILLAGAEDAMIVDENSKVIASAEMDGPETVVNIAAKQYDPHFRRSVMEIGRVTVDVIDNAQIDKLDAVPVKSFEITSNAFKWARSVVDLHLNSLFDDPEATPVIPAELLASAPERAELALAHQGLSITDQDKIVRVTEQ